MTALLEGGAPLPDARVTVGEAGIRFPPRPELRGKRPPPQLPLRPTALGRAVDRQAGCPLCRPRTRERRRSMAEFDDRERAEEAKFKLDQELEFKAQARRAKLVGL